MNSDQNLICLVQFCINQVYDLTTIRAMKCGLMHPVLNLSIPDKNDKY